MRLTAPIPGMSLTKEPGNAPWEQPPLHNTPEEALAFYLDKFDDEETLDDMMFALEAGYPVDAMVDFLTSYSVMEGYHSVDVKMIVSPFLHEYLINLADAAGVEYTEELGPSKEERMAAKQKKRTQVLLTKALGVASTPSPENVAEAKQIVAEAPTEAPVEEPSMDAEPLVAKRTAPPADAVLSGPFVNRREEPLPAEETAPELPVGEEPLPKVIEKSPEKKLPKTRPVKLNLGESPVPSHPSIGEVLNGMSVGDWKTVGAPLKAGPYKGQRPLGKYQVPPANLKKWIKSATKRDYSKEEFLASSEIQQSVAMSAITALKNQHGSWEDAVSAWFTNKPLSKITTQEEANLVKEKVNHFRNGFRRT